MKTTRAVLSVAIMGWVSAFAQAPAPTAVAAPATPPGGPAIKFVETAHDFGRVPQGEIVRRDFIFTNTGSALLEIKDVRPGCGCTTAGEWDKSVAPGKTGKIPLQFN